MTRKQIKRDKTIGLLLRKSREQWGITQDEMAKNLAVSRHMIYRMEGGGLPGGRSFIDVLEYLEIDLIKLLEAHTKE